MAKTKRSNEDAKEVAAHQLIERNLRQLYFETLQQDVPDRFTDLLKKLKSADQEDDRG